MSLFQVTLSGCDDSTTLVLDLTPEQVATLGIVEAECDGVGGGCKPTFTVRAITPEMAAKHRAYTRYDEKVECWECEAPWPCTVARIGGAA